MDEKKRMTFTEMFTLPLDEFLERIELDEGETKRSTNQQFSDYTTEIQDAIGDLIINVSRVQKETDSSPRAIRLGFDCCSAKSRKILRETFNSETMFIMAKLITIRACGACDVRDGIKDVLSGMPGQLLNALKSGRGLPGVQVHALNGDDIPPELWQELENIIKKIEQRQNPEIESQDFGNMRLTKPKRPDSPTQETKDEVDQLLDNMKKHRNDEPGPEKTGDAKE